MPDHIPRLCPDCRAPLPVSSRCTRCAAHTVRAGARRRAPLGPPPGARRRRDPLKEAMEAVQPWIRGERGRWRV